jgi:uncharacterized damage-inducible protein DinB
MSNNNEIKIALKSWENEQTRFNKVLDKISDETLLQEVAPAKNTGIYLLGHLAAVTDAMMPLLGLGQKLYPDAEKIFITTPDKAGQAMPTAAEVKTMFAKVNTAFSEAIKNMPEEEWLHKHNSVSAEDFAKEPHRNKLSVLLSRTVHQAYHGGQISLLV